MLFRSSGVFLIVNEESGDSRWCSIVDGMRTYTADALALAGIESYDVYAYGVDVEFKSYSGNVFTMSGCKDIGVFGMYLNTIDALKNKLGITFDAVKSNTSAGMGMTSPLTPAERASIMRGVDKVYTTFTNLVAQGRNLPVEKVLNIAGVWFV